MKTSFSLVAFSMACLIQSVLANPASPINTPEPMQPGAYDKCEGFWPASPDSTCESIATQHGLSVDSFTSINPQIDQAGGCNNGGILPNYWYCIKAQGGDGPEPGTPAGKLVNPRPTSPPKTTKAEEPPEPPEPTPEAEDDVPTCKADGCWRAFKIGRGRARESYTTWCSKFLERPCNAEANDEIDGVPTLAQLQCTQAPPCSALSSACECFAAGAMDATARI